MRTSACLVGLLLSASLAFAAPALAASVGFACITHNLAGDCAIGESQLSVTLSDAGAGVVRFDFFNAGPDASVISQIYFDDGALLDIAALVSGPGVEFLEGGSPMNLPGGQTVDPPFEATVGFSTQANPSPVKNGVGPGESVAIEFTLQGGQTLQDVIDQLTTGQLRIGLHVIAFDSEGSESFVNRPVPEPTTAALVGGGLLALALRGRKRRRSRA